MTTHSNPLIPRLRAVLIPVPKPGTKPRQLRWGESYTAMFNGAPKVGEDAGECQLHDPPPSGCCVAGAQPTYPPPRVQPHVYAIEPLHAEAADEIERLTRGRDYLREALKRYGHHDQSCDFARCEGPCDCGFERVAYNASSEPPK